MLQLQQLEYKKAYVELYEIIKELPEEDKEKIPKCFIKNLTDNMDMNYRFTLNPQKSILEQEYKVETKALFVELYEKYLANETEKEFWDKYDRICLNMIDKEKQDKYNTDNIFANRKKLEDKITQNDDITSNNNLQNNNLQIELKTESIFQKFKKLMKKIFHLK